MATESLATERVPDILDLLREVLIPIQCQLYGDNAQPLTQDQIEEMQTHERACGNVFSQAQMGLEIVTDYLYASQEHPEEVKLNEASALLRLLTELVFQAQEGGLGACLNLKQHYKLLAERGATPQEPREAKVR